MTEDRVNDIIAELVLSVTDTVTPNGLAASKKATDDIYQWAADYLIQSPQQVEEMPHQYPVEKEVRHEVANEQRNKLKSLGWRRDE